MTAWWRAPDPVAALADRLASKSTEDPATGCLVWTGALHSLGYGRIGLAVPGRRESLSLYAHRLAWEIANGPIPAGMDIDHLCRNRACVRVDHLQPVLHSENVRRRGTQSTVEGADSDGRLTWASGRCKNGHDISDPANVYVRPDGRGRRCRLCGTDYMRRYQSRAVQARSA